MFRRNLFCILLVTITIRSTAQFYDATGLLGVNNINEGTLFGNGISFYDFDHDGWDDLTIANGAGNLLFFKNVAGNFQLITPGINNTQATQVLMLLWADFDNDGDADLLITKDHSPVELWQNDGNFNFSNIAAAAGIEQSNYFYWGAAYSDYDHDGWLDLFISKYYLPVLTPGPEYRSLLYHNNGDGTFTEVALQAGIDLGPRPTFQPVFFDFNGDNWEDLYLVIDRISYANELFMNNGDGTFTNVSVGSGTNVYINAMSGTVGDYDQDSDLDIYVANSQQGNFLLRNNYNGTFTNVAEELGVDVNQVCWGSLFLDYDNDSWEDLFVSVTSPVLAPVGNQYYHNNNGVSFTQVNDELGLDNDPSETYIMAMGDINNDGYYDFISNNDAPYPSKMWMNEGGEHNYFAFTVEGILSNRDGVGTMVKCYSGGEIYTRQIKCGENYTSQNSARTIFGLAENTVVDSIMLKWNSGLVDCYYNLGVNQTVHFIEGSSLAVPFDVVYEGNSVLCPGESVELDAGEFENYSWNTGDTTRFITISSPGQYFVEVVNELGFEITSYPVNFVVNDILDVTVETNNISCYSEATGTVMLEFSGSPVQSILWNTGADSVYVDNLVAGTYNYEVVYGNDCVENGEIIVTQPGPLLVGAMTGDVFCFGENTGSIDLLISGGTPAYQVEWQNLNPDSLYAGNYSVNVVDSLNCIVEVEFEIEEPGELTGSVSVTSEFEDGVLGSAMLTVEGGTMPYEIEWSFSTTGSLFVYDIQAGEYSVEIIDENGCDLHIDFVIDFIDDVRHIGEQNIALYPNPVSEYFHLSGIAEGMVDLRIIGPDGRIFLEATSCDHKEAVTLPGLSPGVYCLEICRESEYTRIPFLVRGE